MFWGFYINLNLIAVVIFSINTISLIYYSKTSTKDKLKTWINYGFLLSLLLIIVISLNFSFIEPVAKIINPYQFILIVITISLGIVILYQNKEVIDVVENKKTEDEKVEKKRNKEFDKKFPFLAKLNMSYGIKLAWQEKRYLNAILKAIISPLIWIIKLPYKLINWMNKEGWKYSLIIITIFVVGIILNLMTSNWSQGYTNFHSGESQFFNLIKSFSSGNFDAIYKRTQPIIIYLYGSIDLIFGGKLSITLMRLITSLSLFTINFFLISKLKKINFLNLKNNNIIFMLIGYTFSYTILFYSNIIRSDIFLLTVFNLFLFEYLSRGIKKINYLILLTALAMVFKGSGILLFGILMILFNYEYIIKPEHSKKIALHKIIFFNILVSSLVYLTFLIFNPTELTNGVFSFFGTVSTGVNHMQSGHYGLFPTNQPLLNLYLSRIISFNISFSPLINIYFLFCVYYFYKFLIKFKIKDVKSSNFRKTIVILLSFGFFVYLISKPLQIYRYYFPFLTVFIILSFFTVSRISINKIKYFLVALFILYNLYFIYLQLNNSRLNVDIDKNVYYVISSYTKNWMLPPGINISRKIGNISQLKSGEYLLITEHFTYTNSRITNKRDMFREEDFYPETNESIEAKAEFYNGLKNLTLIDSTGKNELCGFYLPYDNWYMIKPNYYIYKKE
jgi:hypothetical protein